MRSYWSRVGPLSNRIGVLIRGGETGRHGHRRGEHHEMTRQTLACCSRKTRNSMDQSEEEARKGSPLQEPMDMI